MLFRYISLPVRNI